MHKIVRISSFSGKEKELSQFVFTFLSDKGIDCVREKNNVIAYSKTIMLISPPLCLTLILTQSSQAGTIHLIHFLHQFRMIEFGVLEVMMRSFCSIFDRDFSLFQKLPSSI